MAHWNNILAIWISWYAQKLVNQKSNDYIGNKFIRIWQSLIKMHRWPSSNFRHLWMWLLINVRTTTINNNIYEFIQTSGYSFWNHSSLRHIQIYRFVTFRYFSILVLVYSSFLYRSMHHVVHIDLEVLVNFHSGKKWYDLRNY